MSPKLALGLLFGFVAVLGVMRNEGTAPGPKKVSLSFWNGWTGPDGRAMLTMIRKFEEENPGIEVSMQRMDWATYYNKLMVAEVDGRGPELFVIHASTLPRMNRAGFIADLNRLYGPGGLARDDFDPYVLDQLRYGTATIGVPLDIHPQGLYCNAELLKKAGIVDAMGEPRVPANKEEFLKAAKAMKVSSGNDTSQWGYALTLWRNNFQTLMPQFGGRYFTPDGKADLMNPGNVAAMKFLGELGQTYHLVPPAENALGWVGYRQGKVGMVWEGVYMLGDLQRLDTLKAVAGPIPQIGPKPGTMADSHVLCIRKGLSPERQAASEKFIRYLSAHSLQWAAAGQVPARISVRNTKEFRDMAVQYQFSRQIPYMVYPPRTTILFELSTEVDLAVEKVVRGRATAEEALTVANTNVQRFLDREQAARGKS